MRCDTASVPIRGSKLVGIDSIRKLTAPGSVVTVREQDEIASARKSRREVKKIEEAKEVREVKEVKEKARPIMPRPRLGAVSDPPLLSLPKPPLFPLLPLLTCIAHLAEHDRLPRPSCPRHIRRAFAQRLGCEHGEGKCFLRISRHAKFSRLAHTNSV